MKLVVVTAIHHRYHLTYAFLRAMERIRDNFGVETYAVVTPGDPCIELLKMYRVPYVEYENKPVGRKFNAAVEMLKEVDFTHMMILGSDDIVSDRFIESSLQQDPDNKFDFIGMDGLWFWGMNPRRAGFGRFGYFPVKGVLAGPGKMISRRAVEAVNFRPWPDNVNGGMDAQMMKKTRTAINELGLTPRLNKYSILQVGGFLLDVKYEQHISSLSPIIRRDSEDFGQFRYQEQDPHEVLPQHLSENECNYLFTLYYNVEIEWERLKKDG
jgi:hypothetical protein